jgi:L-threonylcarbamoyladenylate synthase
MFQDTAKQLHEAGAVGVIPTDTVYGVVARAADSQAVQRLYALKSRENKPGTLIAASIEQLEELGFKHRYLKAVEQFWPGAVSVVIPVSAPELKYLHQGKLSLAVRIPDDKELLKLLGKTGPLLTSSANTPGDPPANTAAEAERYFGDKVDFYVNGGDLSGRQPSTVIRILDDAIEVLRQGSVPIDDGTMNS